MDYETFHRKGRDRWRELEELLAKVQRSGLKNLDFDGLETFVSLQRRVVSDFAYARSHFPRTDAERRLRQLSFAAHRHLSRGHEPLPPRVLRFFFSGFREVFREALPSIAVALALLVTSTVMGFVITILNENAATLFLGPAAVEGVREGRLWTDALAVQAPPSLLSSMIFTNNISVALIAWLGGSLLGLGTIYILTTNGMMLGTVISLTWQYRVAGGLMDFISAHGPLELLMIVVAAAAGFELTRGELFPGGSSRSVSFKASARRSMRLALGTVPWLVLLGLVEGFVSPRPEIPGKAKMILGLGLVGAFLIHALLPARRSI